MTDGPAELGPIVYAAPPSFDTISKLGSALEAAWEYLQGQYNAPPPDLMKQVNDALAMPSPQPITQQMIDSFRWGICNYMQRNAIGTSDQEIQGVKAGLSAVFGTPFEAAPKS